MNLRKIILSVILTSVSILMFNCSDDYLELNDVNSINSSTFYKNEAQVNQAIVAVYGQLQTIISEQYIFNELWTDNTTVQIDPANRGEGNRRESYEFWTYEATNANIDVLYKNTYNTIHNINSTLKRMEGADLTDAKRNQFSGELLFLRAYHYFQLVNYFGDVVLLTEPAESLDEAFQTPRSPVNEVYNQIILDLQEASNFLPRKSDYASTDIGRVPKGAALALLGKVYLTVGQSDQAVTVLRQVTNLGYSLLNDYASIFDPSNKNNAESLFEVQFQGGNNLGENSNFAYIFAPRFSNGVITGYPSIFTDGMNMPTNSMISAYEDGDLRKDASLRESYIDIDGSEVDVNYIIKYTHPHSTAARTDDNWPVIRYAEVLLLLAEAINEESGGSSEALDLLNEVRTRAGLASLGGLSQDALRQAIFQERRVELAFENHRYHDLKRLYSDQELVIFLNAHGEEELANPSIDRQGFPFLGGDYDFQVHELLFPIPESQLILNANISQNPNY